MTASQVVSRARSIGDFPNAQFISYQDELNSLNESYKDIYEWLLQNDDDYYLSETTITLTAAMKSPTDNGLGEWWVPVPTDFYRLRYLDVNENGRWTPIQKSPLSARDVSPSNVNYRIRGAYFWITGGISFGTGSQIRVGYYPTPASVTLPDADLVYGTSYTKANFPLITYPVWAPLNRSVCYVYNGTAIYVESQDNNTTITTPVNLSGTLGAAATFLNYYKGYLYWIQSGDVRRAAATLTGGTLTAATLTAVGSITSISVFSDTLYITDSANIRTATLAGGALSTLTATVATYVCKVGTTFAYVTSAGGVSSVGGVALATSGYSQLQTDGTYLFALDTSYQLHQWVVGTSATLTTDTIIRTDVSAVGPDLPSSQRQVFTVPWVQGRLPVVTKEKQELLAISDQVDYSFSYPANIMPEIMAYQCSIDWKMKQKADPNGLLLRLGSRDGPQNTGLWLRLYQAIKRDDYQPQRINNRYSTPWGIW